MDQGQHTSIYKFDIGKENYGSYEPTATDIGNGDTEFYLNVYCHGVRETIAEGLKASEAVNLKVALEQVAGKLLLSIFR